MLQWNNILITEFVVVTLLILGLGLVKAPKFLMRKKLENDSHWGYYADSVPKVDPGSYAEDN